MVQVGFEPKLTFLCPLCHREVEVVHERGKDDWVSEHSGCLNFYVTRTLPRLGGAEMAGPLVFIGVESDFSIKEAVEGLRALSREESDQSKRQKLDVGGKRLESKIGFGEKNLPTIMDALRSGAFGLKIISGRGVSALLWRSGERYLGVAEEANREKGSDAIVATSNLEEAQKFALHWLLYWEQERIITQE